MSSLASFVLDGFERDRKRDPLAWSYLCDRCRLPILTNLQSRYADGNGTWHEACLAGRIPARIEDSRAALAEWNAEIAKQAKESKI